MSKDGDPQDGRNFEIWRRSKSGKGARMVKISERDYDYIAQTTCRDAQRGSKCWNYYVRDYWTGEVFRPLEKGWELVFVKKESEAA